VEGKKRKGRGEEKEEGQTPPEQKFWLLYGLDRL